jgi:fumarylpyruvate hydrolase
VKQDADLAEFVWPVADIVSILSRSMELKPGDVIMTGTPAGVGALVAGDKVVGGIDGLGEIDIAVAQPIVRRPRAS